MKPGRHPRRAYDADGKIFEPPTVADQLAAGYKTVTAWCEGRGCVHHGDISLEGVPPDLPIPDIAVALKLRCSSCGGREIKIQINVSELYDRS